MFTESICSGLRPAAAMAAFAAVICNWADDVFLKAPPKVPNAVRLAATMKIPKTGPESNSD